MARSKFSNTQALDEDYAFQHELDNASGTLNTKIDTTSGTLQVQHDTHLVSDDHLIYVPRDGTRGFTSTVSGVYPIEDYHLATKFYMDDTITTLSGELALYYDYESVEGEASTTAESWITRMTLLASGVAQGRYRLAWYWEWRMSKTGRTHSVRIVLNDDTVNLLADVNQDMIKTTNWASQSGFYHTTLSGGTYHIDMDWMIDSAIGGTTGYIRRTRLEFWRIPEWQQ